MIRSRVLPLLAIVLLVSTGLAGCLSADDALTPAAVDVGTVQVVDGNGTGLAHAQVTALSMGDVVATLSADARGELNLAVLPATTSDVAVSASGFATWEGALSEVPSVLELEALEGPAVPVDDAPVLRFLEPVLLGGAYLGGVEGSCEFYNCGASEPVLEVAGDGTIYASGVCCIGESPPIWFSTDGGATWRELPGDALRENYGIEGDFAIDDAGNLYFSDISVASAYFSSWTGEQEHRWTVPAGPFAPIVDRPWVRAGAEDEVFFLYNAGTDTRFYRSTDGGLTWTPHAIFEGALGNLGQGPERDHLWVAVDGGLWESTDGGLTWEDVGEIPVPEDEGERFMGYSVPVVDEAGNVYLTYDWEHRASAGADAEGTAVYMARYDSQEATWGGPYLVSPDAPGEATHHLPWPAAGAEGRVVVAWYGTSDDAAGPNSVDEDARWFLEVAASVNADAEDPSFQVARADPVAVHEGPMDRKLLDFLQVEIAPDGVVHVAYAQDRGDRPDELTQVVRSTGALPLEPLDYPNGP